MRPAIIAGVFYFAIVFAAGFLLGTIRAIFLTPRFGEFGAVACELPFMLAISWIACGRLIRRYDVAAATAPRAVMGATAFTLLMAAEISFAIIAFGKSFADLTDDWMSAAGMLGLGGQIIFALLPLAQRTLR